MGGDRVLWWALGVSALIHLSMVTVFSIGVYFPRNEVEYFDVEIIDSRTYQPLGAARQPHLRLPSAEQLFQASPSAPGEFNDRGGRNGGLFQADALPQIELPRLEFAELDRLRVRERGLEVRTRYRHHGEGRPQDSWARFGAELERLGDVITRIPYVWDWLDEAGERDHPPIEVASRPAQGFEAYIEWLGEPYDRALLFAPPLDALWGLEPASLPTLSFVLRVNAEGRVLEVLTPHEGDPELTAQVARQLLRYRFTPRDDSRGDQHGAFVIAPAGERP